MRIIDISYRKTDSEHTSPSEGVQGACCQVSINPTYSRQSNDTVNRQPRCARQSFTCKAIARAETRPQPYPDSWQRWRRTPAVERSRPGNGRS